MGKKISEGSRCEFLTLRTNVTHSDIRKTKLKSIHHVLSEATLSLVEENKQGMNQFQVKELFWKLNAIESLLFYLIIELKEDNDEMYKAITNLFDKFLPHEEW